MTSLVEKAKQVKMQLKGGHRQIIGSEEIELAIAWCKDEVRLKQIIKVLGDKYSVSSIVKLAYFLKTAFQKGVLIEKK